MPHGERQWWPTLERSHRSLFRKQAIALYNRTRRERQPINCEKCDKCWRHRGHPASNCPAEESRRPELQSKSRSRECQRPQPSTRKLRSLTLSGSRFYFTRRRRRLIIPRAANPHRASVPGSGTGTGAKSTLRKTSLVPGLASMLNVNVDPVSVAE
jgi:hypothetical protein